MTTIARKKTLKTTPTFTLKELLEQLTTAKGNRRWTLMTRCADMYLINGDVETFRGLMYCVANHKFPSYYSCGNVYEWGSDQGKPSRFSEILAVEVFDEFRPEYSCSARKFDDKSDPHFNELTQVQRLQLAFWMVGIGVIRFCNRWNLEYDQTTNTVKYNPLKSIV